MSLSFFEGIATRLRMVESPTTIMLWYSATIDLGHALTCYGTTAPLVEPGDFRTIHQTLQESEEGTCTAITITGHPSHRFKQIIFTKDSKKTEPLEHIMELLVSYALAHGYPSVVIPFLSRTNKKADETADAEAMLTGYYRAVNQAGNTVDVYIACKYDQDNAAVVFQENHIPFINVF